MKTYLGEQAQKALKKAWEIIEDEDPNNFELEFACLVVRALGECDMAMAQAYSASGPMLANQRLHARVMDQADLALRTMSEMASAHKEMAFALSMGVGSDPVYSEPKEGPPDGESEQ